MKTNEFLDILHDTAELDSITILSPENPEVKQSTPEEAQEKVDDLVETLKSNGVKFHELLSRYEGIDERSFLIENIDFEIAKNIAIYFNQESFIYAEPDPELENEPYVYKKGKTKYEFGFFIADEASESLLSKTHYIKIDSSLNDDFSSFVGEPTKKWTLRFFKDFNPEQSDYIHPYEPSEQVIDGVKESTLNTIREVIGNRRRI